MTVTTGTPMLNGRWRIDVNTAASGAAASYVQVRGVTDFTPGHDTATGDASDYDDGMYDKSYISGISNNPSLTVNRNAYANGFDPGQEALRKKAEETELGTGTGLVTVRFYERVPSGFTGAEAYELDCLVKWVPQGGARNGIGQIKIDLLGQGPRRVIAVPTA